VGLVVQTAEALDDGLLHLVQSLGGLAALGVDPQDRVVVELDLQVARPTAIATEPGGAVSVELAHDLLEIIRRILTPVGQRDGDRPPGPRSRP
jgi:hypothetical protein